MNISDIGAADEALLCRTSKTECCNKVFSPDTIPLGNWYLPNGTTVENRVNRTAASNTSNFFFRNRGRSLVRLIITGNYSLLERGLFYCVIPNSNDDDQVIYVSICEFVTMANNNHDQHKELSCLFMIIVLYLYVSGHWCNDHLSIR